MPYKILLIAVASAALIGAGVGAGTYAAVGGSSKPATRVETQTVASSSSTSPAALTSQQTPMSVGEIYKRDAPSVVQITVTTQGSSGGFFGGSQTQEAQGSGFVYDTQGDIVTDQHVVAGASSITARSLEASDPTSVAL